jgi:hypothetical protein
MIRIPKQHIRTNAAAKLRWLRPESGCNIRGGEGVGGKGGDGVI